MDDKWIGGNPLIGTFIYILALLSAGVSAYYGTGFLPTLFLFIAAFTSGHPRDLFDLEVIEVRPYYKSLIPLLLMILVGADLFYTFVESQPYTMATLGLQVFLVIVAVINPFIGEVTLEDELGRIMQEDENEV